MCRSVQYEYDFWILMDEFFIFPFVPRIHNERWNCSPLKKRLCRCWGCGYVGGRHNVSVECRVTPSQEAAVPEAGQPETNHSDWVQQWHITNCICAKYDFQSHSVAKQRLNKPRCAWMWLWFLKCGEHFSAAMPLLNWGYGTANSANIDIRYRIRDRIQYCTVASLGHGGIFLFICNLRELPG